MSVYCIVDNSVLSELRLGFKQDVAIDHQRVKNIVKIMNRYGINARNVLLTEMLFYELIGLGKVRKGIVQEFSGLIKDEKDLLIAQAFSEEAIARYVDFLESFFYSKLCEKLSPNNLCAIALDYCEKRPFIDPFHCFEQKLIQYAHEVFRYPTVYASLIRTLVVDSVIRHSLLEITSDAYLMVLNCLMKRYFDMAPQHVIALLAGLKKNCEFLKGIKGASQLIRLNDDFADAELSPAVFNGKMDSFGWHPITFLTFESIEKVKERLKACFAGLASMKSKSLFLSRSFCLGRTIIITDLDFPLYEEIPSIEFLKILSPSSYVMINSNTMNLTI